MNTTILTDDQIIAILEQFRPTDEMPDSMAHAITVSRAIERSAIEADRQRRGEVVVTKTPEGEIVAVTRQDDEGKILSVIAEADCKRRGEPVAWLYEDELPDNYPYEAMFPYSKVDGVRMFPVYAPQPAEPVTPRTQFGDERVQKVYEIICGDNHPPYGEHWDGYVSRLIVDALFPSEPVKRKRRYAQGTALVEFGVIPMCDQIDDTPHCPPKFFEEHYENSLEHHQ